MLYASLVVITILFFCCLAEVQMKLMRDALPKLLNNVNTDTLALATGASSCHVSPHIINQSPFVFMLFLCLPKLLKQIILLLV